MMSEIPGQVFQQPPSGTCHSWSLCTNQDDFTPFRFAGTRKLFADMSVHHITLQCHLYNGRNIMTTALLLLVHDEIGKGIAGDQVHDY